MRKIILLFLLFLSVTTVHTLGQNITFSHLTTDDGLSQFSVNSLYIDERGIIWIGTREGLNQYNGNDIKSFKLNKNDPNSLFSNTVLRITGNKNGKVYLLCTDGVAEFDLTTQRFKTLLQGTLFTTTRSCISARGKKYLCTTRVQATSTFSITLREKTSPYPAFIWMGKRIFGWEPPAMAFTAFRRVRLFRNLSRKGISPVSMRILQKNYG